MGHGLSGERVIAVAVPGLDAERRRLGLLDSGSWRLSLLYHHAYHIRSCNGRTLTAAGPQLITFADARAGLAQEHSDLARCAPCPRLHAMPERQMEYVAALAFIGGSTTTGIVARTLGRRTQELSQVRDPLINEGDLYGVHRDHLASEASKMCLTSQRRSAYVRARYWYKH